MTRTIGRVLVTLAILAVTGLMLLVLIGSLADFLSEPNGVITEAERVRQAARFEQLAPPHGFQQGLKLVGVDAVGSANQGISVALSADGNTAIVGGPGPNNADRDRLPFAAPAGVAWVFTRAGGVWTQQGHKLVGNNSEYGGGLWSQGVSVALSDNGDTAIVGGPSDNRTTGAAWVFRRTGGVWAQQGGKLVGTGADRTGEPQMPLGQGMAVALSADGNTAIVGGWRAEAAWVFTRSNGVWTQQGKKLVGSDAVGRACQGTSVALSADGNTAIVGGPSDNTGGRRVPFGLGAAGAAWVFTRSGGVWTQQGDKLVSTGTAGSARQGMSVALSADGDTAIVGGLVGDGGVGAASTFRRSGGHWTQDRKLVGTGALAASSVALSGDGSVIMIGGSNDSGGVGAAWVFHE